ncbi:conserved hypothetical protein [Methylorubrum extorquens AM1]|uniref:Uncharacterized protein n=1 Tax=Methylorubrum extorquens (strain ATCC 14718 / DSM 1338 / JCM 2805 / NCIMB 9133 / AM1) TaxID=272630 RepID=C5ART6_METEA|nr:conserved hypothetical protein [Methylorubrum extorquens AM1]
MAKRIAEIAKAAYSWVPVLACFTDSGHAPTYPACRSS